MGGLEASYVAISALAAAVAVLFRQVARVSEECSRDRRELWNALFVRWRGGGDGLEPPPAPPPAGPLA